MTQPSCIQRPQPKGGDIMKTMSTVMVNGMLVLRYNIICVSCMDTNNAIKAANDVTECVKRPDYKQKIYNAFK